MLQRVKEGLMRRIAATTMPPQQRECDSSRRKMPIQGLRAPAGACAGCASTSDAVTKKSRATLEEGSPYDEADLREVLAKDPVPLEEVCSLSRHGCPAAFRCEVWGYLTSILQPLLSNRAAVLARKRNEYVGYVQSSYEAVDWSAALKTVEEEGSAASAVAASAVRANASVVQRAGGHDDISAMASSGHHLRQVGVRLGVAGDSELLMLKQIRKDVPRMSAGVAYLHHSRVMLSIERILYIWALRHPACGYVQGMNDLITPFISVVLANRFCTSKTVAELHSLGETELDVLLSTEAVTEEAWMYTVEADTYWMASYLLSAVQENYTYNQKGLYSMVEKLEAVVRAADVKLYKHLREELQVDFKQFAFRWMNCLLLRELNATQSLRLWDYYLADVEKDWSTTHVYVCAALLMRWSPALRSEWDYGVVMKFLQNLPTEELGDRDLSALISQGVMMQKLYNNTLNHLTPY
ncbi:putative GTPase activating protein [Trypanosoma grayi]|uniref:putative GTPase activating protein n=1 Tax=Trypanosoma grayi TaxID=71804 RepID=UPI0004F4AD6C|nr:putative GTPase activating protein [Trypanosoma grayi]KEG12311.1 putative GTPase activating protein [Trypanosoma grayi]